MRIVQANAVYDPSFKTADALLDAYRTLTEWSTAVAKAGATVSVVQRFNTGSRVERDGVSYEFSRDSKAPWLSATDAPKEFIDAIVQASPDVVHINGLIFPQLVSAVRAAVGTRTAIVAQHHGGEFPIRGSGLVGIWRRQKWRGGLAAADAISFTAAEQAGPWRSDGVLGDQRVIEIIEASTTMREVSRERARTAIDLGGEPLILWVGRLTTNKDPLTVIDGLERALPELPKARVVMVFGDDTLLPAVDDRVRASSLLSDRVVLAGRVSHDEIPNYYGAADVFVSGSYSEGSGYALIEAMSAGVVPVVTDIPSFRAITGNAGRRWTAGDPEAFARALIDCCSSDLAEQKAEAKAHFDRALSWNAIGSRTVAEYEAILDARRNITP